MAQRFLTHIDAAGRAAMVDVAAKSATVRQAVAAARIVLGEPAFRLVESNSIAKGDVLSVAKIAGIMGAKQTPNLIPLCHPIQLTKVDLALSLDPSRFAVNIEAAVTAHDRTGVEMEAMTAASVAALTVYDMCKAVAKDAFISDIYLLRKTGGKSGTYERTNSHNNNPSTAAST